MLLSNIDKHYHCQLIPQLPKCQD
uniref:Uncharacterized protein n=1 Tax=Anguilla anguilla TaxID=7936 RepID=A0A0E9PA63_ANGAN